MCRATVKWFGFFIPLSKNKFRITERFFDNHFIVYLNRFTKDETLDRGI